MKTTGHVVERFIALAELPDAAAEDSFKLVLKNFQAIKIDIQNCRGQAYDVASVMSGLDYRPG